MQLTLLKAKLFRVCVTHVDSDVEGACAIDGDLMDLAGIHDYEQIQIYNVTNGERLTTYATRAEHGSKIVSLRGAMAHRISVGDRLVICAYAGVNHADLPRFKPVLVYCNDENGVTATRNAIPMQMVS